MSARSGGSHALSAAPAACRRQRVYVYDAAGNLIHDASHSYTYDAEDRLTAVDGGATATYAYDALGKRVQKIAGGVSTQYYYDPAGRVIAEYDGGCGATCPSTSYLYFADELTAEYKNGTTYFFNSDHLGSTRLMTTLTGSTYDNMDYQPYGEQIAGSSGTTHKFEGKERDAETNNDDFGARYYSSSLGRWLSADWSSIPAPVPYANLTNPQTLNLYAMVSDNPESFADLDGHEDGCPTNKTMSGSGQCQTSPSNGNHDRQLSPCQKDQESDCANKTNTGAKTTPDQSQSNQAQQQEEAHEGVSIGVQVGGNAALGVGKAALGATGSAAVVPIEIDAKTKHPNLAAEASGGVIATEGPHVAGHPHQDRSNTTIGAFAGVEGGLLLSNAGNSQGLKQPSETISVDFGLGLGGSVSWTISHGNIISVNVGVAFGFGAAYSDINTATAAKGTDW